ncbi:MAG: hypothetical protein GC157_05310 [Frankiales bacterium]|nr:hypothetical protein [Frankiales bacterium]
MAASLVAASRRADERREELLALAERLAREYRDMPAGGVLRCVSRAVHLARVGNPTPDELPVRAEQLARLLIEQRREPWEPASHRAPDQLSQGA